MRCGGGRCARGRRRSSEVQGNRRGRPFHCPVVSSPPVARPWGDVSPAVTVAQGAANLSVQVARQARGRICPPRPYALLRH
eukprot:6190045-Pyramimonas_sp.AAC.1